MRHSVCTRNLAKGCLSTRQTDSDSSLKTAFDTPPAERSLTVGVGEPISNPYESATATAFSAVSSMLGPE